MKVLLATDGSKQAEDGAALLAHLPHPKTLEVTVLSVNSIPEIYGAIEVAEWMERTSTAGRERALAACQRIEQIFQGANVRVETVVLEGHPGETIVQESQSREIDLVVIGAAGHSIIDRILLGSVSDYVATHVRCSVLVVRPARHHELEQRGIHICVAYDDSEPCKYAIKELSEFDWGRNANFDVVSIMVLPHMYSEIPIEIDTEEIKTATMKTVERGAKSLRDFSSNVHSGIIESSNIGDGIVQFSDKMESDVIVMGNTGRSLLGRFLVGSSSRYVLRHAPCSVWIARSKAR